MEAKTKADTLACLLLLAVLAMLVRAPSDAHPDQKDEREEEGTHSDHVVRDDVRLQPAHQGDGMHDADLIGGLLRSHDDIEAKAEARHACAYREDCEYYV